MAHRLREPFLLMCVSILLVCGRQQSDEAKINEEITNKNAANREDVNVSCNSDEISVTLRKDFVDQRIGWIESFDHICLNDRKCCARILDGGIRINITEKFATCGNKVSIIEEYGGSRKKTEAFYEFSNTVTYFGGDNLISRDIVLAKFQCRYRASQIITAKPSNSDVSAHIIEIKDIDGDMKIYSDTTLHNEFLPREDKESIYVQIKMENVTLSEAYSDAKIASVIRYCQINDSSASSTTRRVVNDGCPSDSNTELYSTGVSMTSSLKVNVIEILSRDAVNMTVNCMVDLCVEEFPSACTPSCRSKRSTNKNRTMKHLQFDGKEVSATIPLISSKEEIASGNIGRPTSIDRSRTISAIAILIGTACLALLLALGYVGFQLRKMDMEISNKKSRPIV